MQFAPAFCRLGLLAALLAGPAEAGVVLLYHHVDTGTPAITSISPERFARHLAILEEEGFSVLPLDELVARSLAGAAADRVAAITFDDAYDSIYHNAWPLLRARNWPFTIFTATGYIGSPAHLNLDQLKTLAAGGASIANHTHSHPHLIRRAENESRDEWAARARAQITEAAGILKAEGFDANLFAYPYGEYNLDLLGIVNALGMIGFGQQSGAIGPHSSPLLLPRFPLAGAYTGEDDFRNKIRSLALPVRHPEIEPLVTRNFKPPLPLAFVEALDLHRLACYGPGGAMTLAAAGAREIIATPSEPLPVGRSRYNCTLPQGNRFYWFSQLWIRKRDDGAWYAEP